MMRLRPCSSPASLLSAPPRSFRPRASLKISDAGRTRELGAADLAGLTHQTISTFDFHDRRLIPTRACRCGRFSIWSGHPPARSCAAAPCAWSWSLIRGTAMRWPIPWPSSNRLSATEQFCRRPRGRGSLVRQLGPAAHRGSRGQAPGEMGAHDHVPGVIPREKKSPPSGAPRPRCSWPTREIAIFPSSIPARADARPGRRGRRDGP